MSSVIQWHSNGDNVMLSCTDCGNSGTRRNAEIRRNSDIDSSFKLKRKLNTDLGISLYALRQFLRNMLDSTSQLMSLLHMIEKFDVMFINK